MELKYELSQFWKNAKKEMKQFYEKIKQHPLTFLTCIIVIIIAMSSLIILPYWRVNQFGITDPKELAGAENSYRATIAQILGGITVGVGIYFAWGNLVTAREGQITERFTRAIDQLGSKELEIRLGGIYALERISNESEKDCWPIMEILTAYVRKNTRKEVMEILAAYARKNSRTEVLKTKKVPLELDIQAILTVLGRCKNSVYNGENKHLNLRGACLEGANLQEANLDRINLSDANLSDAFLRLTNLNQAVLYGTNLTNARLRHTNLVNAVLTEANLENAILEGANLECAYFQGANLKGANFERANLRGAYYLTFDQLSKVKTLYDAELDKELEKTLREKYPALFEKTKGKP